MKTKAPQFELPQIGTGVFNLISEKALDGERVRREMETVAENLQLAKALERRRQHELIPDLP